MVTRMNLQNTKPMKISSTKKEEKVRSLQMNRQVEFTCLICGKKGIDYSGGSKKYCSIGCGNRARRHTSGTPCKYNEGVECAIPNCDACGWNPAVSQDRLDKLLRGSI